MVSETSRNVVPLRVAVRAWFSISLRTFGGPAGQIAVMHKEIVEDRRWIGEERFLHALSYCTLLPGPEAQQLAIYLGWLLNGTGGGLIAGILFVLPGYVVLMGLSAVYAQWGSAFVVTALFAGLGPAVLAIVSQAVYRIGKRSLKSRTLMIISVGSFLALFLFNLPFPVVIGIAAVAGWGLNRFRPRVLTAGSPKPSGSITLPIGPPPLVADEALHCERPSAKRALRLLVVGGMLWAIPIVVALIALGRSHTIVDQSFFFSGTAVVTFGGAYAVLSFVAQRAVESYQWLLPGEMINGLALAETTPGPLIMVVQFVAFLGAYRNPGTLNPWVAALLGSTLTVWVTFVPCFLFVFLGAPHIENLRHNKAISAALTGVTAAVVGVIANLSLYFAIHTLFDRTTEVQSGPLRVGVPVWSTVSVSAVLVSALAAALIFHFNISVLRVLGICAAVGATAHIIFR
jgi:chromate transporter